MSKLNFIFILIDDLGWKDLSCYGSEFYETPNIDRLAINGMRFMNAYAACPVCSPTRASILSGKYPANVGVTNYIGGGERGRLIDARYTDHLPLEECSLGRALGEGGYQTWHVGKWHLGSKEYWPREHGFDVNVGGCDWGLPSNGYFSPWGNPTLEDGYEGEYLTDRLTDEAIDLLDNRDSECPFFLNLWYYSVHVPIQAKKDTIAKYQSKLEAMGLDKMKTFEDGEFYPCEHKRYLRVRRRLVQSDPAYAAMIEHLDENIGRLMDALEEGGIADNTVVIFTSDNGGLATAEGSPTCNAPLAEGKGWMYEGGTREPLIFYAPGLIRENSVCDVPVTSPDFYPTILELAGLDLRPEQHSDGESLAGLIKGDNQPGREAIFWHYPHYGNQGGTPGCVVRAGDWKLMEFFEDGRLELYNLREDIGEKHNLASVETQRVEELHSMLVEWRESCEAKIPAVNPDFIPWQ